MKPPSKFQLQQRDQIEAMQGIGKSKPMTGQLMSVIFDEELIDNLEMVQGKEGYVDTNSDQTKSILNAKNSQKPELTQRSHAQSVNESDALFETKSQRKKVVKF